MGDAQLYTNGHIFTGTGPDDFASAFLVEGGRFTWVGDADAVDAPAAGRVVDLGGRTILPGLLDVHTHAIIAAAWADGVPLLAPTVTSCADMLAELAKHPNVGKGPDAWIEGWGFEETTYPDGRPTAQLLDEHVSSTQPVFVRRSDGHTAICNTRAYELAGIDRFTPDPENGHFEKDDDGELTGWLIETAASAAVDRAKPAADFDHFVQNLVDLNDHYLANGIVAINELYAQFVPDPITKLRAAAARGLKVPVLAFHAWVEFPDGPPDLTEEDRTGPVPIGGVKLFIDGAFSNRTAWTLEPYPGTDEHGMRTATDDDLRGAVAWARRNGVQVRIHCMGDAAASAVIDLFGDEEPWLADIPNIVFDHATLFDAALLERLTSARMRFGVVSHTIFWFAETESYTQALTDTQFNYAYPVKSYYEQVPDFALGSDSPATAWANCDNVFTSVGAAVTRRAHNGADMNAAEAVSVGQALHLYTGRAAGISRLGNVGTIEPGQQAHFVVLDRDPFAIPAEEVGDTLVTETWMNGEAVWTRG